MTTTPEILPPVAIGGVGGSGTRLIADMLRDLGYYMGDRLSGNSSDTLWFTLLFKRVELWDAESSREDFARAVRAFRAVMVEGRPLTQEEEGWVRSLAAEERPQHTAEWLGRQANSLVVAAKREVRHDGPWGWKEPNTHVFLDRLDAAFPGMRYIHVMRNGLDMAYSENQNQVQLWGPYFFGDAQFEVNPRSSLKYWCHVHRRVIRLGEQMPGRFLLLNYDAFCTAPRDGVRALADFLGAPVSPSMESSLASLVRPPTSIGRFKQYGLDSFDPADVEYVKSLGFET